MLSLSPTQAALIALVCGGWLAAAIWATLRGLSRARAASAERGAAGGEHVLLDASPALPLIVEANGRLDGSPQLAALFGLTELPDRLRRLEGDQRGAPRERGARA